MHSPVERPLISDRFDLRGKDFGQCGELVLRVASIAQVRSHATKMEPGIAREIGQPVGAGLQRDRAGYGNAVPAAYGCKLCGRCEQTPGELLRAARIVD